MPKEARGLLQPHWKMSLVKEVNAIGVFQKINVI